MVDSVSFKVDTARLAAKFKAMVPAAEKLLSEAAMAGARDVAAYARALVAKDTGALAASIVVEAVPERLGARVAAGGTPGTFRWVREGAETAKEFKHGSKTLDVAFMKEFGTKRHRNKGKFSGSWHPGTKAEPFLYPAAKLNAPRNQRRMSRALSQALKTAK